MRNKESVPADKYFKELAIQLNREGISFGTMENEQMPILMEGGEIGAVLPGGRMRIQKKFVNEPIFSELIDQVSQIAAEVCEYMNLMNNAPPLQVCGLNEPYFKLAEFNGLVLCGKESECGVQFTTYVRDCDGFGLAFGQYFGRDYSEAKQNFAMRSGLIRGKKLFTPNEYTEIYRCCTEMLNERFHLTWEQEEMIEGIQAKILDLVPDINLRLQGLEPPRLGFPEQTM